jgi:hypothetical protein
VVICSNIVALAQLPRTAMYRYQSNSDNQALAAGDNRKSFIGKTNWSQVGLVGYVYREPAPETVPLMEVTKYMSGGNKFFYTTSMEEANELLKDKAWNISTFNKGYSCYVSLTKKPGTIPVYRYRQGTDKLNYMYIVGDKENASFLKIASNAGMKFEKVAFYIWEKQADSSVDDTTAGQDNSKSKENPKVIITGIIKTPVIIAKLPPMVDLNMRPALYIDTFQQTKVDAKAKYATPGNPVTVFRADNTNCDQNACGFQLGFYLVRDNSAGKTTAKVKITNGKYVKTETVTFEPDKKVADLVVHLPINNGNNQVIIEVDPNNEIVESNEKNNRFEVNVILKP